MAPIVIAGRGYLPRTGRTYSWAAHPRHIARIFARYRRIALFEIVEISSRGPSPGFPHDYGIDTSLLPRITVHADKVIRTAYPADLVFEAPGDPAQAVASVAAGGGASELHAPRHRRVLPNRQDRGNRTPTGTGTATSYQPVEARAPGRAKSTAPDTRSGANIVAGDGGL